MYVHWTQCPKSWIDMCKASFDPPILVGQARKLVLNSPTHSLCMCPSSIKKICMTLCYSSKPQGLRPNPWFKLLHFANNCTETEATTCLQYRGMHKRECILRFEGIVRGHVLEHPGMHDHEGHSIAQRSCTTCIMM